MIVVLVILAILAAIMVPQLTGYIDKAKDKQYQIRCRNILIAAQTIMDEEYALESVGATGKEITLNDPVKAEGTSKGVNYQKAILDLAEEDITKVTISKLTVGDGFKITKLKIDFKEPTKYAAYDGATKEWTISDTSISDTTAVPGA